MGLIKKYAADTKLAINEQSVLQVVPPTSGLPVQKFLTAAGDGTGAYNANLDFSGAITDWFYTAPYQYDIYTILLSISDNANWNSGDYGALPGGLTNGVQLVYRYASGLEQILLSGISFKYNYQWLSITSDTGITSFAGTTQTGYIAFHMNEEYGQPFRLNPGDSFRVRFHDNFTGLVNHTFGLRGILQIP